MSVTNGQFANETIFNAAFASRTQAQAIDGGKTFSKYIGTTRADIATSATIAALASTTSFVKLTGSTATALQGITAGAAGQHLTLFNGSTANITVTHLSGSASAANRISLPNSANIILIPSASIEFIYDSNQSYWVLKSGVSLSSLAGDLLPSVDDTYNIGSDPLRWKEAFLNDLDVDQVALFSGKVRWSNATDNTSGTAVTLSTPTSPVANLTNASLVSIAGITAGARGQLIILANRTGVSVSVLDMDAGASAADRIHTGTGGDITLVDDASLLLIYDHVDDDWHVIGGSGSGGSSARYVASFTGTSVTPDSAASSQTFLYTGGSAQSFSTTGFGTISGLTEGVRITLLGSSDTNTITIADSDITDGRLMNGDAVLGKGNAITFEYNSTLARMVEISRNF